MSHDLFFSHGVFHSWISLKCLQSSEVSDHSSPDICVVAALLVRPSGVGRSRFIFLASALLLCLHENPSFVSLVPVICLQEI
jgi:hypothetical protein